MSSTDKCDDPAHRLKILSIAGIAVSLSTALFCIIICPIVYYHIQYMNSVLQHEIDYCKSHTDSVWDQITEGRTSERAQKIKRHSYDAYRASYGSYAAQRIQEYIRPSGRSEGVFIQAVQQTCGCGIGSPGQPGPRGSDGKDGSDGRPGSNGSNGSDGKIEGHVVAKEPCYECPPPVAGAPGEPGPKGIKGVPGAAGRNAINGKPGKPGAAGPPGAKGLQGMPGVKGVPGVPGRIVNKEAPCGPEGPAGPPGTPGPQGPDGPHGAPGFPGPPGEKGPKGQIGRNGRPGVAGEPGAPGEPGTGGDCSHCPQPRTGQGY